eukprot:375284_1
MLLLGILLLCLITNINVQAVDTDFIYPAYYPKQYLSDDWSGYCSNDCSLVPYNKSNCRNVTYPLIYYYSSSNEYCYADSSVKSIVQEIYHINSKNVYVTILFNKLYEQIDLTNDSIGHSIQYIDRYAWNSISNNITKRQNMETQMNCRLSQLIPGGYAQFIMDFNITTSKHFNMTYLFGTSIFDEYYIYNIWYTCFPISTYSLSAEIIDGTPPPHDRSSINVQFGYEPCINGFQFSHDFLITKTGAHGKFVISNDKTISQLQIIKDINRILKYTGFINLADEYVALCLFLANIMISYFVVIGLKIYDIKIGFRQVQTNYVIVYIILLQIIIFTSYNSYLTYSKCLAEDQVTGNSITDFRYLALTVLAVFSIYWLFTCNKCNKNKDKHQKFTRCDCCILYLIINGVMGFMFWWYVGSLQYASYLFMAYPPKQYIYLLGYFPYGPNLNTLSTIFIVLIWKPLSHSSCCNFKVISYTVCHFVCFLGIGAYGYILPFFLIFDLDVTLPWYEILGYSIVIIIALGLWFVLKNRCCLNNCINTCFLTCYLQIIFGFMVVLYLLSEACLLGREYGDDSSWCPWFDSFDYQLFVWAPIIPYFIYCYFGVLCSKIWTEFIILNLMWIITVLLTEYYVPVQFLFIAFIIPFWIIIIFWNRNELKSFILNTISMYLGLFSLLTDIIVIYKWIQHNDYWWAIIQIGLLIITELFIIIDVYSYNKLSIRKCECDTIFGLTAPLLLMKSWSDLSDEQHYKTIYYRYKAVKLMFTSFPSVILQLYVSLTNPTFTVSLFASILASFISLTFTVWLFFIKLSKDKFVQTYASIIVAKSPKTSYDDFKYENEPTVSIEMSKTQTNKTHDKTEKISKKPLLQKYSHVFHNKCFFTHLYLFMVSDVFIRSIPIITLIAFIRNEFGDGSKIATIIFIILAIIILIFSFYMNKIMRIDSENNTNN